MRVYLRGKSYDLVRARLKDKWADCDSPNETNRKIRINSKIKNESELLLDCIIHESLHNIWDLDEQAINEISSDIAKILYKLGARIVLE